MTTGPTPPRDESDDSQGPDLSALFGELFGDPSLADNPQLRDALKQMGVADLPPAQQQMLARQMRDLFTGPGPDGPVDVALTTDVARKLATAGGDASVSDTDARAVTEAVHVAQMWLDQVTSFDAAPAAAHAWSRAEWIEATMPTWVRLVGPVADGVTGALTSAMRGQLDQLTSGGLTGIPGMELPPGTNPAALMAQMGPMMHKVATTMMGAQIGQAVGTLSGDVLSGTEVGLPLLPDHAVALLPAAVDEFTQGLEIDAAAVRLYLAAREAARSRLFTGTSWIASELANAVQAYARDIRIDVDGIAEKLSGVDPSDPQALQSAVGADLFSPEPSPAQKQALTHLETLLALTEGWVDVVAAAATRAHLPNVDALAEAVRRRRATGGPAEQIFGQLVGLEMRPRRLREAAALFTALEEAGGADLRDQAWSHPDVAPTAGDLDDPHGYVARLRSGGDDLDSELAALLDGGLGEAPADPNETPRDGEGSDGQGDGSDGPASAR